jgi:hypothetical protein
MKITDETPIVMLTVGQLKEILTEFITENPQKEIKIDITGEKYAYGLRGIREAFRVSHATAQKYKDGILKDAITQYGRKIIVDVEKARELFAKAKQ